MANVSLLAPKILKWEGGYVNDPVDPGGATNMGITLATWKQVGYDKNNDGVIDEKDIKLLDKNDFQTVLKRNYWDKWQADLINNQSVAEILVDWFWISGVYGITIPQRILGLPQDGKVGPHTIEAVNQQNPQSFFSTIFNARVKFLNDIVVNSIAKYEAKIGRKSTDAEQLKFTSRRFIQGWMNRLKDFTFQG